MADRMTLGGRNGGGGPENDRVAVVDQQPVTMVEKIRESYQRHSRNVSAVSDISALAAEPLRRDADADIRCVLLCDSEVERNCVFEAVGKALVDGESAIGAVHLVNHHWEQPRLDCGGGGGGCGENCKQCVRLYPGSTFSAMAAEHKDGGPLPLDGYFRFTLNGTTFRLMLLSKDRQNLLKIYSFDFIFVGMQVTSSQGLLDQRIWEFEWKRLNRHSKRAVAPIIVLGYFRDVLKLGSGDLSLHKTVEESRQAIKKVGRTHNAIPRFCDFVTGNSVQLESLFGDVERLYRQPGFVLQQCAYVDNRAHFFKIVENPNLSEDDVQYRCDKTGDSPVMIAAKLRHKDLVSSVMRSPKFLNADGSDLLRNVIHARNNTGQTLLAMVALQGKLNNNACNEVIVMFKSIDTFQVPNLKSRSY